MSNKLNELFCVVAEMREPHGYVRIVIFIINKNESAVRGWEKEKTISPKIRTPHNQPIEGDKKKAD